LDRVRCKCRLLPRSPAHALAEAKQHSDLAASVKREQSAATRYRRNVPRPVADGFSFAQDLRRVGGPDTRAQAHSRLPHTWYARVALMRQQRHSVAHVRERGPESAYPDHLPCQSTGLREPTPKRSALEKAQANDSDMRMPTRAALLHVLPRSTIRGRISRCSRATGTEISGYTIASTCCAQIVPSDWRSTLTVLSPGPSWDAIG